MRRPRHRNQLLRQHLDRAACRRKNRLRPIVTGPGMETGRETDRMDYEVGDIVKLKKKHPCGSQEWEILRVGADFRLKCLGCGHQIMTPRKLVEKNTRGIRKKLENIE